MLEGWGGENGNVHPFCLYREAKKCNSAQTTIKEMVFNENTPFFVWKPL